MNCAKPFIQKGNAYGCGHCVPCRIKKRREWTHRMMLEAATHGENSIVTLTYSPENEPADLSVRPSISSGFIKRLRFNTQAKFRYFAVGEYGNESFRPHYHLALFGFPACIYGRSRHHVDGGSQYCCFVCQRIAQAWTIKGNYLGRIESGLLTPKSMAYVAGYINKKMTRDTDPRLEGRRPEFARMSLRPGLGYGMMHEIASTLMEFGLDTLSDVPVFLDHGRKRYPLGRYLRRSLRKILGRDPKTPEEALEAFRQSMQPLRETAFANSVSLKSEVLKASEGRRIQIAARSELYETKRRI